MSATLHCERCGTSRPLAEIPGRYLILRSCCRAALVQVVDLAQRCVATQGLLLMWDDFRKNETPKNDEDAVSRNPIVRALAHSFRQQSGELRIEREPENPT